MSSVISRVFMNGNSQAVRIPQEFRLESCRVEISRNEQGDLVIHPMPTDQGTALLQALKCFDDVVGQDYALRLADARRDQPPVQDRDAL